MSETEEQLPPPEPEAPPPEPKPPPPPAREAGDAEDPVERRIARLTARLSSAARERDEFAARLAALENYQRQQAPPQQPVDPQYQQAVQAEGQRIAAYERTQEKIRTFHETGAAEYPDWRQRCTDLQAMGADSQIAELLVEMPAGPKIAAALSNDPEAVERIASLRGERARAIALGQYAEKLAAQPARNVSKAPPPPKPVEGRVSSAYDIYNPRNTPDEMVDYFIKQDIDRRRRA